MMPNRHHLARLEFTSAFDMLNFVQLVGDHISRQVGLDEDARHSVDVAIRESVINAIKHGSGADRTKHVVVEFEIDTSVGSTAAGSGDGSPEIKVLIIRVRDEGEGFDPAALADPLAPENLLKPSGRGIFLIRSFMDDVQIARLSGGGMEICMTKRIQPGSTKSALRRQV